MQKKDKALQIALGLVDENLTVHAIHDKLTELVGWEKITDIAAALYPHSAELEKVDRWIERERAIQAKLDAEGKQLFLKYDSDRSDREHTRAIAHFHLGFAAGMKLNYR